jgi:hypothetical protein
MENPGERLVGDYLRHIRGCDFVDFNVYTKAVQGEIDVIGVASSSRHAYVCEVVTHLTTGIQYVGKNSRADTADRLIRKFVKDIEYGRSAFPDYSVEYMLWSPVVRLSKPNVVYNQFGHLEKITEQIKSRTGVEITIVSNSAYLKSIQELRVYARQETKELKSPIMRFLQIEEWTRKNCENIAKKERLPP